MKLSIMKVLLFILFAIATTSCNQKKPADKNQHKNNKPATADEIEKVIDSLGKFKPVPLSIKTEHSDVDEFIPIGYNEEGTIAYFVSENTGASSGVRFDIGPSFGYFTMKSSFDMDMGLDSILPYNKEFIYQSLKTAKIKLDNSIKKISLDSFKARYKYIFDTRKTMGAPDTNWSTDKKTLARITMSYHMVDNNYPVFIKNETYVPEDGIYDIYISDCFTVKGRDGETGYLVIVTEGLGFEGYTRKTIEIVSLGLIYQ